MGVSVFGVGKIFTHKRGVFVEVVILLRYGTKPTHSPHQPLIDRQLVAIGRTVEFSRLPREVL